MTHTDAREGREGGRYLCLLIQYQLLFVCIHAKGEIQNITYVILHNKKSDKVTTK